MAKQIPLSGPNSKGKFAIVDDEDYAAVSAYSWRYSGGYVVANRGNLRIHFHHLILGDPSPGFVVDHIDGDPLNNQRCNLRFATHTQNKQNAASRRNSTSRFKGVHWSSRRELWIAQIKFNKKQTYLGEFISELDAARAYNEAAVQHFGEYARLNVIPNDAVEPVRYRQAVPSANNRTSKYLGVSWKTGEKRWVAQIHAKSKVIFLGYFDTEEAAAHVYDAAAKLHHGDRAFLNFPNQLDVVEAIP